MSFELLESFERMNVWVGVVESDDVAHCHQVVICQVITEAASVRFGVLRNKALSLDVLATYFFDECRNAFIEGGRSYRQRPTHGVLYQTRLVFFWLDLPEFFDSNPVDLPFVARVEVELVHE